MSSSRYNTALAAFENLSTFFGTSLKAGNYVRGRNRHEEQLKLERDLHNVELSQAFEFHEKECSLEKKQHSEEISLDKYQHIVSVNTTLEQHFHQLNTDLINATREAERDMFEQKNSEYQTLIFCGTVMFTALTVVVVQGKLPQYIPEIYYIIMAVTSTTSFSFLFFSILISFKIVLRSTHYMYRRADKQTKNVRNLIQQIISLLNKIRYVELSHSNDIYRMPNSYNAIIYNRKYPFQNNSSQIQRMHDVVIETYCVVKERSKDWTRAEDELNAETISHHSHDSTNIQLRSSRRRDLEDAGYSNSNEKSVRSEEVDISSNEVFSADDGGLEERITSAGARPGNYVFGRSYRVSRAGMFFNFWWQDGELQGRVAVALFHAGSALMLLSIALYVYAWFDEEYDSPVGARIGAVLIGLAFVLGVLVTICLRDQPGYDSATDRYIL